MSAIKPQTLISSKAWRRLFVVDEIEEEIVGVNNKCRDKMVSYPARDIVVGLSFLVILYGFGQVKCNNLPRLANQNENHKQQTSRQVPIPHTRPTVDERRVVVFYID